MNPRFIKWSLSIAAMMFISQGCAVFVRDGDHHYRHHWWGRHSSVEQPNEATSQIVAQEGGQQVTVK